MASNLPDTGKITKLLQKGKVDSLEKELGKYSESALAEWAASLPPELLNQIVDALPTDSPVLDVIDPKDTLLFNSFNGTDFVSYLFDGANLQQLGPFIHSAAGSNGHLYVGAQSGFLRYDPATGTTDVVAAAYEVFDIAVLNGAVYTYGFDRDLFEWVVGVVGEDGTVATLLPPFAPNNGFHALGERLVIATGTLLGPDNVAVYDPLLGWQTYDVAGEEAVFDYDVAGDFVFLLTDDNFFLSSPSLVALNLTTGETSTLLEDFAATFIFSDIRAGDGDVLVTISIFNGDNQIARLDGATGTLSFLPGEGQYVMEQEGGYIFYATADGSISRYNEASAAVDVFQGPNINGVIGELYQGSFYFSGRTAATGDIGLYRITESGAVEFVRDFADNWGLLISGELNGLLVFGASDDGGVPHLWTYNGSIFTEHDLFFNGAGNFIVESDVLNETLGTSLGIAIA